MRIKVFGCILLIICTPLTLVLLGVSSFAFAEQWIELPTLAASSDSPNDPGMFSLQVMSWDEKPEPSPLSVQYGMDSLNFNGGGTIPGTIEKQATLHALGYAVTRTPDVYLTGTIVIQGASYVWTRTDGPSAGAAMTVGFIALLRGDALQRGVAMTGTLEQNGTIGLVGGLRGKLRAAAREHYRLVLIPAGQLYEVEWNLQGLARDLNITVKEVSTIDEAYQLMTGVPL